jgi:hypothetical protein
LQSGAPFCADFAWCERHSVSVCNDRGFSGRHARSDAFQASPRKVFHRLPGRLPLLVAHQKEYFNFFTKEDLKNNLTITPGERSVTVQLRVPVRSSRGGSHIHFTKTYELDKAPVAQCKAGMGIFPFYRVMDAEEGLQALNEYTVLFADKNEKMQVAALNFWPVERIIRKEPLSVPKPEPRTRKGVSAASYYYKVPAAFDPHELRLRMKWVANTVVLSCRSSRKYTTGKPRASTRLASTSGRQTRTLLTRKVQLIGSPNPSLSASARCRWCCLMVLVPG